MSERLLPMAAVRELVGLSPSMIYRLIGQGQFPTPGKFGTRSLWLKSEVDAWIAERARLKSMGQNMGPKCAA